MTMNKLKQIIPHFLLIKSDKKLHLQTFYSKIDEFISSNLI